jgi:bifunctional N-acetylglucosamine-1-phosphate-uridyltransferase/glucosamine-1-phosphate-acetyltransferase GlmU-like protein
VPADALAVGRSRQVNKEGWRRRPRISAVPES